MEITNGGAIALTDTKVTLQTSTAGVVFPGGYYLRTGDTKQFGGDTSAFEFERRIDSPNGEDVLYVFYRRDQGRYTLFPYNLIRKEMQNPIQANGYSLFSDGRLVVFRQQGEEPTRLHPMQVWKTPFMSAEHAAAADWPGLFNYRSQAPHAALMHPTDEHLLPFYVAAGAAGAAPVALRLHDSVTYGCLGMDAYAFGD